MKAPTSHEIKRGGGGFVSFYYIGYRVVEPQVAALQGLDPPQGLGMKKKLTPALLLFSIYFKNRGSVFARQFGKSHNIP